MTIFILNSSVALVTSAIFIGVLYGHFQIPINFTLYIITPTLTFAFGCLLFRPTWNIRMFCFGYVGLGLTVLITFIIGYLGLHKIVDLDAVGAGVWFLIGFPVLSLALGATGVYIGMHANDYPSIGRK
jgi:hypothetical protein